MGLITHLSSSQKRKKTTKPTKTELKNDKNHFQPPPLQMATLEQLNVLKNILAPDQVQLSTDGANIWVFDLDNLLDSLVKFIIQKRLPFDHFGNPCLTKLIQETLQPGYQHVSRTTLKHDCLKMWKKAKEQLTPVLT